MAKYSVHQQPVETLLSWIKAGEIAIPEIQRPFVWKASKVRDLIDSLYKGYPVGYIITWRNPDVKLKNGKMDPSEYMDKVKEQIKNNIFELSTIDNEVILANNLKINEIPEILFEANDSDYEPFLKERRQLMAKKIKNYYEQL